MQAELINMNFKNTVVWSRGVDHQKFGNYQKLDLGPGPIFSYIGRVATEKNIQAFLDLDLEGTKVIIGKGPDLNNLKKKFPKDIFLGEKTNGELASHFASSDVFVFPSKTDTFGIVVLESLNCGTPVAAYPVPGPKDILGGTNIDTLDDDLKASALKALKVSRQDCLDFAKNIHGKKQQKYFLKIFHLIIKDNIHYIC